MSIPYEYLKDRMEFNFGLKLELHFYAYSWENKAETVSEDVSQSSRKNWYTRLPHIEQVFQANRMYII